jgi:glycosyltransferase involved in cell wall biosynthesis
MNCKSIENTMMKFSIITVCYNAEDCIEGTIKSVLHQSYKNIEYIIIDGGSTDNTLKIIKKYEGKINIIVSEPDRGIYNAMNKGQKLAKGEYLNFLNAGDTFSKKNTLSIVNENIKNETKIISGDFNLISTNNKPRIIKTKKITWKYFKKDFYACHQAIFIHSSIVSFYDVNYKIKADYKWVLDALSKTEEGSVVKIHQPLVNYDANGFSSQNSFNNLNELMRLHKNYFGTLQLLLNLDVYVFRLLRDLKSRFI